MQAMREDVVSEKLDAEDLREMMLRALAKAERELEKEGLFLAHSDGTGCLKEAVKLEPQTLAGIDRATTPFWKKDRKP
jgi:hypothetical protein